MNLIDFEDGTFTFVKELQSGEVEKLKKNVSKDAVSTNYKGIELLTVYKSAAGVLASFEGMDLLFDSLDDLDKAIKDGFYTEMAVREVMFKKNPYGKNFDSQTKQLITALLTDLKIDTNTSLDQDLLKSVEDKIAQLPKPYHFYRSHFIHITALLGEVILSKHPSWKWDIVLAGDQQTWNPYLADKNARHPFFIDFYEHLFLNNELDSILLLVYGIYE
jgi:hypothetical protein